MKSGELFFNGKFRRGVSSFLLSVMVLFILQPAYAEASAFAKASADRSADRPAFAQASADRPCFGENTDIRGYVSTDVHGFGGQLVHHGSINCGGISEATPIRPPTSGLRPLSIHSNPFKYSGYYQDSESGMYYLNARYYTPEIMRFISRDTYDLSNRYSYCDGDPISETDQTGHMPKWGNLGLSVGNVIGNVMMLCSGNPLLMATGATQIGAASTSGRTSQTLTYVSLALAAGIVIIPVMLFRDGLPPRPQEAPRPLRALHPPEAPHPPEALRPAAAANNPVEMQPVAQPPPGAVRIRAIRPSGYPTVARQAGVAEVPEVPVRPPSPLNPDMEGAQWTDRNPGATPETRAATNHEYTVNGIPAGHYCRCVRKYNRIYKKYRRLVDDQNPDTLRIRMQLSRELNILLRRLVPS